MVDALSKFNANRITFKKEISQSIWSSEEIFKHLFYLKYLNYIRIPEKNWKRIYSIGDLLKNSILKFNFSFTLNSIGKEFLLKNKLGYDQIGQVSIRKVLICECVKVYFPKLTIIVAPKSLCISTQSPGFANTLHSSSPHSIFFLLKYRKTYISITK